MNDNKFYFLFKKIYLTLLISFLSLSMLLAQDCSDQTLRQARKNYDIGKFDDVINGLTKCSKYLGQNGRSLLEESYAILASTYIAIDNIAEASEYVSLLISSNPYYQPSNESSIIFQKLVEQAKNGDIETQISSVSKISENISEAPATVMIITEDQIRRRGYQDLEALLHDLPGFDISRSNGLFYSSIYQRGYRSKNTNRTLLLVDGVEENGLWGNAVYLSRQYPITNIKSVEVMYGPASTIYGANAFLGVISINTKKASDFIKEGERFGLKAEAGVGAWNTRYADVTFAGKSSKYPIQFSVTGRAFHSDEPDWGDMSEFDYEIPSVDSLRSTYRNTLGITTRKETQAFLDSINSASSPYYLHRNDSIILTEAGVRRAWELDKVVLDNADYTDFSRIYYLSARVKIGDLQLGVNNQWRNEGTGAWYSDYRFGTAQTDANGRPRQGWGRNTTSFFIKYDKNLGNKFSITSFTRYKVHGNNPYNKLTTRQAYAFGDFSLLDLFRENPSYWSDQSLIVKSNQIRSETRFIYRASANFNIVSGIESRFSVVQGDYVKGTASTPDTPTDEIPEEEGTIANLPLGGNHFFIQDHGAFSQASIGVSEDLRLTLGARIDYNRIRITRGYGLQFNPRIAVVYSPKNFVFKAIYARAFKDATLSERFSTVQGTRDVPADFYARATTQRGLQAETVNNFEVTARSIFDNGLNIEAGAYYARYDNSIETNTATIRYRGVTYTDTEVLTSSGERRISGGFVNIHYKPERLSNLDIYGNYTFTNPLDYGDTVVLRIADIASHQINVVANYQLKNRFNVNLRTNWVGAKETGTGTTVPANTATFKPYIVFFGAVSYDLEDRGLSFQLSLNNITNAKYFSPGVRTANHTTYAMSLPQNKRNVQFRVRYSF